MNKRQSPLKNAMLTGLLTVSLAGFTVPVFAGGSPAEECEEHGASYFAKCDFNKDGICVKDPDSKGDVTIVGDETSGTWSSETAIDIMIVKGGQLRDPTMYDPAENNGSYDNDGIENKDISHLTFCVYEQQQQGACVVTFEDEETQSCYQWHHQGDEACQATVGTTLTPPGMEVIGAEWHLNDNCKNLGVKLLATGVSLTAKVAGKKVKLELTTSAEPDTAALTILRGNKLGNGGTEIDVACSFASGGSPYTCTDDVVGDTYQVLETEYDGSVIVYGEVTPE
jgi:hypothetical protein